MLKKLWGVFVIVIAVSLFFNTVAYGADKVDIYDPDTPATEQTVLTITRPEGKEIPYSKSYEICGYANKENVTVLFLILNDKDSKYVEFKDVNGESKWENIGVYFAKEVILKEGKNCIRIVAYSKNNPDEIQISDLTIKVVNKKSVADKIKEIKDGILNTINQMLSPND
ncbi:hypothetical protein CDQ84_15665 [Clostridium thermosuccinogenes]|jgi:hypothetical protein|uniref:Uncharacterized protein n=1 Tax=Clostridium thermosuccinogenes TaxID=84032 RepID=A0A2K2FBR5_9CLOT|nr:hypothetical protein [Pseudoclostridium thermosuccinogenes]AUS98523.1 hypothetical protein CDO33_19945 [Pseudoclostridium thermosuccinogenes]PNT90812.1 hypothetical protein CDQ83_13250 [Pseudoclostridium thermosuccinogenes]PNT95314.1 hypothetical protein CDQ85_15380 [Pseudoclostridium thermosuccinogenes]PNT96226.1 hypothetical protein CDQ84_15665 [Pseudoclostridium thermosuccinogenes]